MTITVSDASALDITSSITLSCWAKLTPNTQDVHSLMAKDNAYGMAVGKSDKNNPGFVGKIGDGSSIIYTIEDTQVWIDDIWHFFTFTFLDDSRARLYVDGFLTQEDSNVNISLGTNDSDLLMAEWNQKSWGFQGVIDECRLWDDERTKTEIQDQQFLELSGDETDLNGYWPISNGSGTTIFDETANDNDGTLASDGEWVQRKSEVTDYFKSPTGNPDIGLSKPQPSKVTNTDVYKADDGTIKSYIDVDVPKLPRKAKYQEVIYRQNNQSNWQVAEKLNNDTTPKTVTINELSPDISYEIATRTFSTVNSLASVVQASNSPFTTSTKTTSPIDVPNFSANTSKGQDHISLSWDKVNQVDIDYYEVQYGLNNENPSWDNNTITLETNGSETTTKDIYVNTPGKTYKWFIKAVDTSGNESDNAATDVTSYGTVFVRGGSSDRIYGLALSDLTEKDLTELTSDIWVGGCATPSGKLVTVNVNKQVKHNSNLLEYWDVTPNYSTLDLDGMDATVDIESVFAIWRDTGDADVIEKRNWANGNVEWSKQDPFLNNGFANSVDCDSNQSSGGYVWFGGKGSEYVSGGVGYSFGEIRVYQKDGTFIDKVDGSNITNWSEDPTAGRPYIRLLSTGEAIVGAGQGMAKLEVSSGSINEIWSNSIHTRQLSINKNDNIVTNSIELIDSSDGSILKDKSVSEAVENLECIPSGKTIAAAENSTIYELDENLDVIETHNIEQVDGTPTLYGVTPGRISTFPNEW